MVQSVIFSLCAIGFSVFLFVLLVILRVMNPDYQTDIFLSVRGVVLINRMDGDALSFHERGENGFRFNVDSNLISAHVAWEYAPVPFADDAKYEQTAS